MGAATGRVVMEGATFMHHLNGCNGELGAGSLGAVERLDLHGIGVGDAGAASLASALEKNATLQTLNLSFNKVGAAGAASLASALEKNATLQKLDLIMAEVGAAGAASLASALEKNATLQTLMLGSNGVGDAGAASLASALEKNATLQTLSLCNNEVMGDSGAASLASALPRCRGSTLASTRWALRARRRSSGSSRRLSGTRTRPLALNECIHWHSAVMCECFDAL